MVQIILEHDKNKANIALIGRERKNTRCKSTQATIALFQQSKGEDATQDRDVGHGNAGRGL